ncbi:MAG TPA: hypothetical protein VM143_10845 [Acidimicrobiales bacterium]|nr:hypothetical protein [Acidimicrobiales bacterium]
MAGAMVRIETNQLPNAIATLAEVVAAAHDLGQPWLGVGASSALARAHLLEGDLDGARRLVDWGIAASDTIGVLPQQRARLLAVHAELLIAGGDTAAADGAARHAVTTAAAAGLLPLPGDPEVTAARVARSVGDWERAMRLAASAVERVREHDVRIGATDALELVSDLLPDAGEHEWAARLAATALALRSEMGLRVVRTTPADSEPMTLDRAIADALRRRGRRGRPRSRWDALTPAESEVVDLVTEGPANKQIAARLRASPGPSAPTSRACSRSSACATARSSQLLAYVILLTIRPADGATVSA